MASESIAHSAFGLMGYWLRAHLALGIIVKERVDCTVNFLKGGHLLDRHYVFPLREMFVLLIESPLKGVKKGREQL